MSDKPAVERAYASGVQISLGLVNMLGELVTLKVPNAGKGEQFSYVCPKCDEPHKLSQKYLCNDDPSHGPYSISECDRGKEVDGKMVRFTTEQVSATKASVLPEKTFALQIHHRADIENATYPSGNAYLFRPTGNLPFYMLLREMIRRRPELMFVAKANLRKSDSFVQVDLGLDGQLMIRELVWPEDMKTFEAPAEEAVDEKFVAQFDQLVEALISDEFNAEEYKKDSRLRIAELVESGGTEPSGTVAKPPAQDLTQLLEAALAAAAK